MDTGCVLATIDEEMGRIGPVPSGCGANRQRILLVLFSAACTRI
jgi:hypothetical protein